MHQLLVLSVNTTFGKASMHLKTPSLDSGSQAECSVYRPLIQNGIICELLYEFTLINSSNYKAWELNFMWIIPTFLRNSNCYSLSLINILHLISNILILIFARWEFPWQNYCQKLLLCNTWRLEPLRRGNGGTHFVPFVLPAFYLLHG